MAEMTVHQALLIADFIITAVQAEREEIASMAEMGLKDPQEARAFAARIRARGKEEGCPDQ